MSVVNTNGKDISMQHLWSVPCVTSIVIYIIFLSHHCEVGFLKVTQLVSEALKIESVVPS